jgi:acyl-CoA thioesterase FadM
MLLRTILTFFRTRHMPSVDMHDVGRLTMRVWPADLDTLGHVNNGVYFSLMDLGRFSLMKASGAWQRLMKLGYYPVVVNETMTFRRSLQPWQKYTLETRIAGYDERAVYVQQRFVAGGQIYAEGFVRARFLKKAGGTVSVGELSAVLGIDTSEPVLPAWVQAWVEAVTLPSTRQDAPSDW